MSQPFRHKVKPALSWISTISIQGKKILIHSSKGCPKWPSLGVSVQKEIIMNTMNVSMVSAW